MKYLRRIIITILAVAFIASVVIGMGVIFAVRNVNVSLNCYSYEEGDKQAEKHIAEYKEKILQNVRGTLIDLVSEDEIASLIDGDYSLESVKKVYPCTLNVTLKERKETFSVALSDGKYALYDENGVLLDGSASKRSSFDVALELKNDETVEKAASVCSVFKSKFSALRSMVKSVVFEDAAFASMPYDNLVTFNLRCGVGIEIRDYSKSFTDKMNAVFKCFTELSSENKTTGKIMCSVAANGEWEAWHTTADI